MKKIAFIIIFCIAAALRFWQLGAVPASPDWDEAALGYNAYSIIQTGKDEYGSPYPLSLRSFDDYKPPLYMYLTIPFVAALGLEPWVVRLPSAVFGTATVAAVCFLVYELLTVFAVGKKDDRAKLSLIVMALLALSPWHIQFSRIAFEANIGLTLNVFGLLFFFLGLKRGYLLSITAILFGLGLYAYHSERIFLPAMVVLLAVLFRKELWEKRTWVGMALVAGCITVAPLVPVFMNKTTLTRLQGTSSLADQTALLSRSVVKLEEDARNGNPLGVIFDNRRLVWARTVTAGYLSHFSMRWLFLTGDNPRHHAPDMGLLYLVELPFLLWGMYKVGVMGGRFAAFVFGWFLIAPIAAAPTTGVPHAIRTLVFLPTFQIFTAFGFFQVINDLRLTIHDRNRAKRLLFGYFVIFVVLLNVVYYLHMYFNHMNREYSLSWQYGYKQAVEYVKETGNKYTSVVVSTKLEQPHMFFLFYLKYDPKKYLAEGGTASGGFAEYRNKFDKYVFRTIDWDKEVKDGKTLYIGTPGEIPVANLETIHYLDGTEAMRIADK